MLYRNSYYALAYAANDVVLITLWVLASMEDLSYLPMILCFSMFFINDLVRGLPAGSCGADPAGESLTNVKKQAETAAKKAAVSAYHRHPFHWRYLISSSSASNSDVLIVG